MLRAVTDGVLARVGGGNAEAAQKDMRIDAPHGRLYSWLLNAPFVTNSMKPRS
jgi:hypothetical protein